MTSVSKRKGVLGALLMGLAGCATGGTRVARTSTSTATPSSSPSPSPSPSSATPTAPRIPSTLPSPHAPLPSLEPPAGVTATSLPLPPVARYALPPGLAVEVLPRHDLPLARVVLSIPLGGYDERRSQLGVATLTAAMLTKGTAERSGDALAALIEDRGGELVAASEQDVTTVSCEGFAQDVALCLDLVADVTLHPSFPEAELGPVKDRLVAVLEQRRDEPVDLAREHFENLVFGERHPDGWVLEPEDVTKLGRKELEAFWKKAGPRGSTLAVSGDVDAEKVREVAARLFGAWRASTPPRREPRAWKLPAPAPTHVWLVDKPDLTQASFRLGHLGLRKQDPELYALWLVNDIFGGGDFSSRLMQKVRVEHALTYGIGSAVAAGRYDGHLYVAASSRNETVVDALLETVAEMRRMKSEGPTQEELRRAQSYWAGSYPFSLENPDALLEALVAAEQDGLDEKFVPDLAVRMGQVSLAASGEVARRRLDPDHLVVVIVGKADTIAPALRAARLPFTRLDYQEPISAGARAAAASSPRRHRH